LFLDPAEHDGLAAGAQHLAALYSALLLKTTTASPGWRELHKFAGNEYYSATLAATADPASQQALMLAQRDALARWIDLSIQNLRELKALLAQEDTTALEKWFETMLAAREQWLAGQVGQGTAPDLSEARATMLRMFVGGLATRAPKDKKRQGR
jgi:prephenate dehydrogenase